MRSFAAPRGEAGFFGDGANLSVGAGALRTARSLQASRRAGCTRRNGGRHESSHDLDLLLPATRVLRRLRRTLFAGELSCAEFVHAAALSGGLLPKPSQL